MSRGDIPGARVRLYIVHYPLFRVVLDGVILVNGLRMSRIVREGVVQGTHPFARLELSGDLVVRVPAIVIQRFPVIIGRNAIRASPDDILEPVVRQRVIYVPVLVEPGYAVRLELRKCVP